VLQIHTMPRRDSPPKFIIHKLARSAILAAAGEHSNRFVRHLVRKYKRLLKKVTNLEQAKKQVGSKAFRIIRQNRQQRDFKRHSLKTKTAVENGQNGQHGTLAVVLMDKIRKLGADMRRNLMRLDRNGKDLESIACEVEKLKDESSGSAEVEVDLKCFGV
jgi:hypothetical protein